MRRDLLPPPRLIAHEAAEALTGGRTTDEAEAIEAIAAVEVGAVGVPGAGAATGEPPAEPRDVRLGEPSRARPRRRYLFDPKFGWFRRLEREASLLLSRHVFPRIPLLSTPYDWLLRRQLTLSKAEIQLAGLPPAFDGFTILLISDLHAGPFVSAGALTEAMERLTALKPDLIAVAGDLTSSQIGELTTHRRAFEVLDAPYGVYATLGNHDHYTERPRELRRMIEDLGIRMLHNTSTRIEREGQQLCLAGVDDLLRGQPDLDAALDGTESPVILMSHNPDLFFRAARRGVALVLSGHTHGGQMRIPGLPVLVRQSRYRLDEGRYQAGGTELIVSRGIGAVGVPWRMACTPEAVLIRLERAADAAGSNGC